MTEPILFTMGDLGIWWMGVLPGDDTNEIRFQGTTGISGSFTGSVDPYKDAAATVYSGGTYTEGSGKELDVNFTGPPAKTFKLYKKQVIANDYWPAVTLVADALLVVWELEMGVYTPGILFQSTSDRDAFLGGGGSSNNPGDKNA